MIVILLANSIDPDQPVHSWRLIGIYIVRFLIHKIISDQKATSVDPDQMVWM
jgi:hypothetical protein